ncbi:MAG: hypothetical protein DMF57_10610 [Acidobacteria bacterium]|nr:MAG: hypothetical protein DMF57_10610 [Acidobacteriota bacterium]
MKDPDATGGAVFCSFCHKSQRDVKTIVQGPTACICDECVAICEETISSRKGVLRKIMRLRPFRWPDRDLSQK